MWYLESHRRMIAALQPACNIEEIWNIIRQPRFQRRVETRGFARKPAAQYYMCILHIGSTESLHRKSNIILDAARKLAFEIEGLPTMRLTFRLAQNVLLEQVRCNNSCFHSLTAEKDTSSRKVDLAPPKRCNRNLMIVKKFEQQCWPPEESICILEEVLGGTSSLFLAGGRDQD